MPRPSKRSGRRELRAVVDTNVWVSGLIVPNSPPGRILEAIRTRRITPLATWELAEEIAEVLRRPELRRYRIEEEDIVELLAILAPFLPTVDVPVTLRDKDDLHVVSAAVSGKAGAIITGDQDLLADPDRRRWLTRNRVALFTPAEAVDALINS